LKEFRYTLSTPPGLRETDDEVEKIGIERSWKEIEKSDVVLLLVDARNGVGEADREILAPTSGTPETDYRL
jgi:tRNA U34 5-carboxymethylaminomethyl modifying GTPase MnmE/TrmE